MEFNIGDKVLLNTKGAAGWEADDWERIAGIVEGEVLEVGGVKEDSIRFLGKRFSHPKIKLAKLLGEQNERV